MGTLHTARVYDVRNGGHVEGARFLVDRLWPRGVAKDSLPLSGWPKELTPSSQLRKDFHDGTLTWEQFSRAYRSELDDRGAEGELEEVLRTVGSELKDRDVLLLFAGKDTEHTHANVLKDWLTGRIAGRKGG